MNVIGIDPAARLGFASLDMFKGSIDISGAEDFSKYARLARWPKLRFWMKAFINTTEAKLAVVEGYGFGNVHSLGSLVECGTLVRLTLMEEKIPFIEVPPTTLKKFICGSGAAKKELLIKEVYKRWQLDSSDNNEVDAFCLAQFGRAALKMDVGLPVAQTALALPFGEKLDTSFLNKPN
jgi:crossover junction endodeoxyribonuclease RuvC